jgi:hypothetical protein
MCITPDFDCDCIATFYKAENHIARTPHWCNECPRHIAPGETYERVIATWEGKFETFKTCPVCLELRKHVYCGGNGVHGSLWTDITETYLDEMGLDCLEGLSDAARDAMIEAADRRW